MILAESVVGLAGANGWFQSGGEGRCSGLPSSPFPNGVTEGNC